MIITIFSTDLITNIGGVPVRVWKGKTEKGTDCFVFVHRLAVHASQDATEFELELQEQSGPTQIVDLRQVL